MRLDNLLSNKGKKYFYIMHLSYRHGKDVKRLWNYAKDNNLIGLDPLIELSGEWNEVKKVYKS